VTGLKEQLEVDQVGPASQLQVGDLFVFTDGQDRNQHEVTQDLGSHLEYDGRVNRRLSKDVMVKRVGAPNPGERTERAVQALMGAVQTLEKTGDVQAWSVAMSDVISRAAASGMEDAVLPLEKLAKQGSAVFARAREQHGKAASDLLVPAVKKRWAADVASVAQVVRSSLMENVRRVVRGYLQGLSRQVGQK